MPLNGDIVGATSPASVNVASLRWLMAYAAGAGASGPRYYATDAPIPVGAHPVFAACLEWPALQGLRLFQPRSGLTDAELARNVHGSFDVTFERPILAGEELTTVATVIGVEQRGPNAWQHIKVDTTDTGGQLVFRSYQSGVFLDVTAQVDALRGERPPAWPEAGEQGVSGETIAIPVPVGAAHVYTETSRIWNPVHTDIAAARSAGLPGLILHGTATLAYAVSVLVARYAEGDPSAVRRVSCRFGAPVSFPSSIVLEARRHSAAAITFRVLNAAGAPAIRAGFLSFQGA